jgi:hypothetical protein
MTGGDSASVDSTRTTINTGGGGGGCGAAGCIANSNLTITDNPVYSYRGLMVDSSRHFLSAKTLKHLINGRASLKLNVLHWHLIDMCRYGSRLHPGFCRVRVSPVAHHGYFVRFFRQEFTLEDAIGSTHLLRLKLLHAFDQWHSSRMSAASHRCYCKLHLKAFTVQSAMFPQLVQTVQSALFPQLVQTVQSAMFPQLVQTACAPAATYSKDDLAAVVRYAQLRGVRVMPEFDIPDHGAWRAIPSLNMSACPTVRCAFSDGNLHSRMPLVPMPARLKRCHACDQWHSSRVSAPLTSSHCKLRPNTKGTGRHHPPSRMRFWLNGIPLG